MISFSLVYIFFSFSNFNTLTYTNNNNEWKKETRAKHFTIRLIFENNFNKIHLCYTHTYTHTFLSWTQCHITLDLQNFFRHLIALFFLLKYILFWWCNSELHPFLSDCTRCDVKWCKNKENETKYTKQLLFRMHCAQSIVENYRSIGLNSNC